MAEREHVEPETRSWRGAALFQVAWQNSGVPLSVPFDLGDGIFLDRVPEWVSLHPLMADLSLIDRRRVSAASFALRADWASSPSSDGSLEEAFRKFKAKCRAANLALWLAQPSQAVTDLIFVCDPSGIYWQYDPLLVPHRFDAERNLMPGDLDRARELLAAMSRPFEGTAIQVAVDAANAGLTAGAWELRYLSLWIALEALFGVETVVPSASHYFRGRLARFVADSKIRRPGTSYTQTRASVKKAHEFRNKIVHGSANANKSPDYRGKFVHGTEEFLRIAMCEILMIPKLISTFSSEKTRTEFLDRLTQGD